MKSFRLYVFVLLSLVVVPAYAAPSITGISPSSGPVGSSVTISGTGFGATQGASTISLNSANVSVMSWSDSAIIAVVPAGASSGPFSVSVGGQSANSSTFTVTPLPSGWSQADIGSTGVSGSGSYANGTFTVQGAGQQIWGTADAFHFAYQPWSGDGTIVARVVSMNGSAAYRSAGVMIRETLDAGSTNAKTSAWPYYGQICFDLRATTGGNSSEPGCPTLSVPYWVKVVRSGNTFTSFQGPDGVNWTQIGSGQTINMSQNVYFGLAVTSGATSATATAMFDNVSVSSTSSPAPVISSLSPSSGLPGSQVMVNGSGFGTSQGGSVVTLNGIPVGVKSWSTSAYLGDWDRHSCGRCHRPGTGIGCAHAQRQQLHGLHSAFKPSFRLDRPRYWRRGHQRQRHLCQWHFYGERRRVPDQQYSRCVSFCVSAFVRRRNNRSAGGECARQRQ